MIQTKTGAELDLLFTNPERIRIQYFLTSLISVAYLAYSGVQEHNCAQRIVGKWPSCSRTPELSWAELLRAQLCCTAQK